MNPADKSEAVRLHWSNVSGAIDSSGRLLKVRWWQHPAIVRHINQNVCGQPVVGLSEGLNLRARALLAGRLPLLKGISVGGGSGIKEMKLLADGMLQFFDLFELAEARIAAGKELATKRGLQDAMCFVNGDAFELAALPEQYDLVHWNNSLHHMMDVGQAIEWSWRVLKPGGLFYMDDFVGPDLFQWSPSMLLVATAVRQSLADRFLVNPQNRSAMLPRIVEKIDPERLRRTDPSEAAESSRILDLVRQRFPGCEIILTGGVVYHLALSNLLANFREEDDSLLERLLTLDDLCTATGETHYAVALALKC
jgi:ubiquinone/menaquinone biosynthesis C-methylase UbiE